ncbi:MAG: nicotinate phosphoribosyltransferase [Calditrichaeota bacterium]|nr:MAG: nicotinate phosphoribosyltransferase [Calditrichota bacterium]
MKAPDRRTAEGILFTDEYQLTMAQVYFRNGLHRREAQFDHFFRSYPDYGLHQAGYCINAGLEWLLDWMEEAHFRDEDIEYLRSQRNRAGEPLLADDFLHYLRHEFTFEAITLRAIPEGRVVHPQVPLTVVQGPLAVAQVLETPLLNHLNYQTLIATKAARILDSGRGQLLLEFGLRRAHGTGANAGARAALIGGAHFTSNVGISHVLGLPPKGTLAHSLIQTFIALGGTELDAFRAFAEVYPDDCILLVDTIDTLNSGVPNAIKVFEELRRKGHKPVGVRLDSGDLAYLSIQVAKMLDEAGFPDTIIVLSNNLDELVIWQIITQIQQEAARYGVDPDRLLKRLTYGVGTRLITSHGASSLGGVYKLVAVRTDGEWVPAIKISESPEKTPNPGNKRVWRIYDHRGKATADLLALAEENPPEMEPLVLHHPSEPTKKRKLSQHHISRMEQLHVEVLREGRRVYEFPSLEEIRRVREADLECLDAGIRRLVNPHVYHVSCTGRLWQLKQELIAAVKNDRNSSSDKT